jgi:hypothetical protein
MARRDTQTLPRPVEVPQVPGRISKRTLALWMPIVLMALLAVGIVVGFLVASPSAPAVQPGQQTETGTGAEEIVPPVDENPPAQIEPEVVAPAPPVVVDYRVVWVEVQGFDPSTIPVEDGIYDGTMPNGYSYVPGDPNSFPKTAAYAWKILPQLEGERADWNKNILVAAVRAPENKDVVLVSISADGNPPYILLSVDGEKSWYKLNLLWKGIPYGDATRVRITLAGDEIHLYGKDARPGNNWWAATVSKSKLP